MRFCTISNDIRPTIETSFSLTMCCFVYIIKELAFLCCLLIRYVPSGDFPFCSCWVVNNSTFVFSVTELCEYAGNVDVPIARESIRAVGKIALQQYDVNAIVDRLLQFLEMEKDYVTAETLVSGLVSNISCIINQHELNYRSSINQIYNSRVLCNS